MPPPGRVATLVLAAGGSARLGQPKQLVIFQGRPLLVHAAETALAAALGPVWLVLGAYAGAIAPAIAPLPVRVHVHSNWADGLGSSIAAGCAAILSDPAGPPAGILLMLADQPGLTPAHLQALHAAWLASDHAAAASAYADTRGVPALLGPAYFAGLQALRGPNGARPLLAQAAAISFPAGTWDIDTPADLP